MINPFRTTLAVLLASLICLSSVQAEEVVHRASDQSFSVRLPARFEPSASPPSGTVLSVEVPGTRVFLDCSKSEAVELDGSVFADKMKRNLFDAGAQIYGKAKAPLAGKPAASFLVGGIRPGKESLFVFNQRPDAVYTFVLNYPVGQRKQASKLWNSIAPSFKFAPVMAKPKKS